MAKLRAAFSLGADAKPSEMLRTFTAKYVGADRVAQMETQLAELRQRDQDRAKQERQGAAERFADAAIEKFRQTKDKRDLIIEAYVDAEEKKAGSGPGGG